MGSSETNPTLAIEALHDTARSCIKAESPEEAANIAVNAIRDILGMPNNGVFLYDDAQHRLRPVAWTTRGKKLVGDIPTFSPGDSIAWEVFEAEEPQIYGDVASANGRFNPDTSIGSEIILPLPNHGVILIGSRQTNAFNDQDVSLALLVASHLTTALDRIQRERELRRKNERLDEFTSIISHDLLNPLNIAQGRIELAQDETGNEHLEDAANAVNRSIELVTDLRTLAREGERVGQLEAVELGEIAKRCWQNIRTVDATLIVDTGRTIRADPSRLKQLLENLFRNAVEHGGENVTIKIGDLDEGFYVSDDGPGIPDKGRRRVFKTGYSTKEGGTGFGLSIVREIVDAHEWNLTVTDGESGGAQFVVTGVETGTNA